MGINKMNHHGWQLLLSMVMGSGRNWEQRKLLGQRRDRNHEAKEKKKYEKEVWNRF
jgi:hypothetical protein